MEGSFEAKLTAKRETAAGIFLTVQVQPDDFTTDLATLRVGSALILGWAEIVNTAVEKIELDQGPAPSHGSTANGKREALDSAPANKERRPFASLPLSQQAGLRCQDNDFKLYLDASNAEHAAEKVRIMCDIQSRSELDDVKNAMARESWFSLLDDYDRWLTDRMYKEMRR